MKDLLFKNPTFRKGLNITVRNGAKWFDALNAGDMVCLVDADTNEVIMLADVLFCDAVPLDEIPALWLRFEHDPSCHTVAGLRAELMRVYGDEEIVDPLTVIAFLTSKSYDPDPAPVPAPRPEPEESD